MTVHHDIALALSVFLVLGCVVLLVLRGGAVADVKDTIKDIIGFATTIAVATFAHAQGVKSGTAAALKSNGHTASDAK